MASFDVTTSVTGSTALVLFLVSYVFTVFLFAALLGLG